MSEVNYEKLVNIISKISGLEKSEIEGKVKAKVDKISGLISKEGAAQIIAAELGVVIENEKLKIDELVHGMRKANFVGKIIGVSPVRKFMRNGQENKVANLIVADETSNIKTVLWDTNHIEMIETGKIADGSIVEIVNASIRDNEAHLGSFSDLKMSNEVLNEVKTERVKREKNISDFKIADNVKARAFVVQTFEPRFFYVCPECRKKAINGGSDFTCEAHGKIVPEKRALINIVIDDGTATVRTVLFHESLNKLGVTNPDDIDLLIRQRQDVLGREMFFIGNVRMNKFFNEPEFVIEDINEINVDEIVEKLFI
ncbi:MAG: hypothetical protein ABIH49_01420 [archaeon]